MAKATAKSKKRSTAPPAVEAPPPPRWFFIQTRVPPGLFDRVKKHAAAEMISVSDYVRRLVATHTPGGP
jgi:hypothetical protein